MSGLTLCLDQEGIANTTRAVPLSSSSCSFVSIVTFFSLYFRELYTTAKPTFDLFLPPLRLCMCFS